MLSIQKSKKILDFFVKIYYSMYCKDAKITVLSVSSKKPGRISPNCVSLLYNSHKRNDSR